MAVLETDILVQLIRAKHACLVQLRDMGRRQLELIEAGDLTALLELLSAKQRPLSELQRAERALGPFRAQNAAERRWPSPEDRAACAAQIEAMRRAVAGNYRTGTTQRNNDGPPPRPGRRAIAGHPCGRAGPRRLHGRVTSGIQSTQSPF